MLRLTLQGRWMACVVLFFVSTSWVRGEQLPLRRYTTADGLPSDQITSIVRDSRGYLWFCTPEGLSRFDGRQFTNYKAGLKHPDVRAFLEGRDGVFWVGARGGLYRFYPRGSRQDAKKTANHWKDESPQGHFVPFDLGPASSSVNALLEDAEGVWCGTGNGLYRVPVAAGRAESVNIGLPESGELGRIIRALARDREGNLWIGSGSGLYRRHPSGRVRRFTTRDGLPYIGVRSFAIDSLGTVWAGTIHGLCEITPGSRFDDPVTIRVYTHRDGLFTDNIRSLLLASDGRLWIGLPEAIASLTPGSPISSIGTDVHTFAMAEDIGRDFWLGTDVGAFRVARNGFVTYGLKDGLIHDAIAAIFEDRKGDLCVVSTARQLSLDKFSGTRFVSIVPKAVRKLEEIGWGWNQLTLQDSRGEWWLPTGEGLYRFPAVDASRLANTPPKHVYTTLNGLPSNDVFRLYEEPGGDLWVATFSEARNSLCIWQRRTETFHTFTEAEGLPADLPQAHALKADRNGAIWIGCEQATLLRYQNGRFTVFTSQEGVPPGDVWALHLDRMNRLWLGSSFSGLARIEGLEGNKLKLIRYSTANGLSSDAIQALAEDFSGNLYLATGRGVDRLNPASGEIRHYSQADGLANGPIRSVHCDRQGNLWFGAIEGLSKLTPIAEKRQPAQQVLITRLSIAGESYPVSELGEASVELPRLSAAEHNVSIGFASPEFGVAMPVHYQYMLEGADSGWSPQTTQQEVHYSNLSPGRYRFVARSVSPDGANHPVAASVSFLILPPLWQRWWFLSFLAAAVISVAYAFHRYRVRQITQLERVRTTIATDLHDDIGAGLSQIAILSEVAKQGTSAERRSPDGQLTSQLSQIANLSREMIDSMGEIVWAINPTSDRLEELSQRMRRFASDMLTARNLDLRFTAPGNLSAKLGPNLRRQVFLIFKESVNNLVTHSGCTLAEIDIGVKEDALWLRVCDNGKGFNMADAPTGHGLSNMRRRAALLGGRLDVISSPGNGTAIELNVSLN